MTPPEGLTVGLGHMSTPGTPTDNPPDTPQKDVTCISQSLNDALPNYLNINYLNMLWHAAGYPG